MATTPDNPTSDESDDQTDKITADHYTPALRADIAKATGIIDEEKLGFTINAIVVAANYYLDLRVTFDEEPRAGEKRDELTKLHRQLGKILESIEKLDDRIWLPVHMATMGFTDYFTEQVLSDERQNAHFEGKGEFGNKIQNIYNLYEDVGSALENTPPVVAGAPSKVAMPKFHELLGIIYEQLTGKKPTLVSRAGGHEGKFAEFVAACRTPIPGADFRNLRALGEQLRVTVTKFR